MGTIVANETTEKGRGAGGRFQLAGDLEAPLQQPPASRADEGPALVAGQGPVAFHKQDYVYGTDQVGGRLDQGSIEGESNGRPSSAMSSVTVQGSSSGQGNQVKYMRHSSARANISAACWIPEGQFCNMTILGSDAGAGVKRNVNIVMIVDDFLVDLSL